ncbi:hypothetical protein FRC07_013124, partial [Ceratobasidium sp. 392]
MNMEIMSLDFNAIILLHKHLPQVNAVATGDANAPLDPAEPLDYFDTTESADQVHASLPAGLLDIADSSAPAGPSASAGPSAPDAPASHADPAHPTNALCHSTILIL